MSDPLAAPELSGPVAITGITGFVGGALARRLVEAGITVRGLVRRDTAPLPADIERIRGGLGDPAALDALVAGASLLVHCAGAVRGADRTDFDRVNVAGTELLLTRVARSSPGMRVIHLSTLAAREPTLSHYAASKQAAEALFDDATDCRWTLLRPTAVYGPGDRELAPLLTTMARGLAPIPMVAGARVTLIHIDDLVTAIVAAAASPACIGGCFELGDARGDGYDWAELAGAVARIRNRRVHRIPVPTGLLRTLGGMNVVLARLLRRAPMLSPGKVRELTHPDWSCDSARFRQLTGWQPAVDLDAGLATVIRRA